MVAVKGLPLAYNKDLQETQEPLFDASDTLLQMLPLVTGWMKAVEFQSRAHAASGAVGIYECVGCGYLSSEARRAVEAGARADWQSGSVMYRARMRTAGSAARGTAKSLSPAFDQDFYESLKLASVLAVHDVAGGTAPSRVRHAIQVARKKIESLREEAHAHA